MLYNQAEALVVGAAAKAWADGPLAEQRLPHAQLEESRGSGPSLVEVKAEAKARERPAKVGCVLHNASIYHTVQICNLLPYRPHITVLWPDLWPAALKH